MPNDDDEVTRTDREQQLCEILAAYFEAVEAGQAPDRAEWLARHPDFAEQLGRFLDGQDRLLKLTEPLRPIAETADEKSANDPAQMFLELTAGLADRRRPALESTNGPAGVSSDTPLRYVGDYELIDVIARGGTGVVFRARQRSLNRLVALKMLRADAFATEADEERFLREAKAAANLDHPNIVPIIEVGRHHEHNYFSMKLVEGANLAQRLRDFGADQRATAQLIATIARAVRHAHERGILHRDLKPSNILVDEQGEPLVTDFGLAKWVEEEFELTQSGTILGTPGYMAPEQALGKKGTATTATDVYGLGAILYTLLTGRPPFQADSVLETIEDVRGREPDPPSSVNRCVDRDLETICLKCLEKEPGRRYHSAQDVADELERWLRGEPIKARRVGPFEQTWRWCRRNPRAAAILVLTTAFALCAAVGFILLLNARDRVARANRDLLTHERLTRRRLLLSDVLRASDLINSNKIGEARDLLARHVPSAGAEDQRNFGWYYLWRLCNVGRRTLRGHKRDVYHVEFSPDGKTLVSSGDDKTVRIWDVATANSLRVLTGHTFDVNAVTFSPDGKTLASASDDRTIKLWDLRNGRKPQTLSGHRDAVVAVNYTPDGQRVVSCGHDGQIIIWDSRTGLQQSTFSATGSATECMAISADGTTLAVGGRGIAVWDLATRRRKLVLDRDEPQVRAISFHGSQSLVTTHGNELRCWHAVTGKPLASLDHLGHTLFSIQHHPDPRLMAWVDDQGIVGFWDGPSGYNGRILTGQDRVWCLAFAPDGRTLATASRDGTIKLWDTMRDRDRYVIPVASPGVDSLTHSPDRQLLSGAAADGKVWSWRMPEGQVVHERKFIFSGKPIRTTLSKDATTVAILDSDRSCEVRDVKTGRRIFSRRIEDPKVNDLQLSHDGKWLSVNENDGTGNRIRVWNTESGRGQFVRDSRTYCQMAFSPGCDRLVWGDDTWGWPRSFDLATAAISGGSVRGHAGGIRLLEFSASGKNLATSSIDRTIRLWDAETFEERLTLRTPQGDATALAISPDERTLAFCSGGRSLTFADFQTGEICIDIDLFASSKSMSFSPDGTILATSADAPGSSSVVYLWPAPRAD